MMNEHKNPTLNPRTVRFLRDEAINRHALATKTLADIRPTDVNNSSEYIDKSAIVIYAPDDSAYCKILKDRIGDLQDQVMKIEDLKMYYPLCKVNCPRCNDEDGIELDNEHPLVDVAFGFDEETEGPEYEASYYSYVCTECGLSFMIEAIIQTPRL